LGSSLSYAVVAKSLHKNYGEIHALRGVSFRIRRGEIYSILGPNGAGKTTTVKAIVGGVKLSGGEVYVLGYDVSKNPLQVRALVGVMSELPGLFPELSIYQNLKLMGKLYGMSEPEVNKRINELAEFIGLSRFLNRKYYTLSKGLKRRADLIASLIHDPEVLLLDEPTSGVDVRSRVLLHKKLESLLKHGKTIIITTHNISEAMEISHRVLVLARGKVVAEGTPAELRNKVTSERLLEIVLSRITRTFLKKLRSELDIKSMDIRGNALRFTASDVTESLGKILELVREESIKILDVNSNPEPWDKVLLKLTGEEVTVT